MTERELNEKLEDMVGISRAFQLVRIATRATQAASGNRFVAHPPKWQRTAEDHFIDIAKREGFSGQAIDFYLAFFW
jgi:hypothetical protein